MAQQNQKEEVLHHFMAGSNTKVVIRHIVDAKGRNFLDLRQAFRPDPEEAPDEWAFTRYGIRLTAKDFEAIKGFKFPKDPVDTKTVTTRIDNTIKLPTTPDKAAK